MLRTGTTTKLTLLAVGGWLALTLGAAAPAGTGPSGVLLVDPASGPVGTTVTVTGGDCGNTASGLRTGDDANASVTYVPDTGRLRIFVTTWPEPFATTGIAGTNNDAAGNSSATFVVPSVATGPYMVTGTCEGLCPPLRAGALVCAVTPGNRSGAIRASSLGPYASGTTFTVTAPAVVPTPVVTPPALTG